MKLTAERLRELLHYNPDTGQFVRLVSTSSNARAGDMAGTSTGDGYFRIRIDGKEYKAHRLVWLYMTGEFPADMIDHINGVKDDNRWCNLREATNQQNQFNTPKKSTGKSGFKGATWDKSKGKWMAAIVINGRRFFLGYFDNPEEAGEMYAGCAPWIHGKFHRPTINITINNYFGELK